jgi:hypothetical protein
MFTPEQEKRLGLHDNKPTTIAAYSMGHTCISRGAALCSSAFLTGGAGLANSGMSCSCSCFSAGRMGGAGNLNAAGAVSDFCSAGRGVSTAKSEGQDGYLGMCTSRRYMQLAARADHIQPRFHYSYYLKEYCIGYQNRPCLPILFANGTGTLSGAAAVPAGFGCD